MKSIVSHKIAAHRSLITALLLIFSLMPLSSARVKASDTADTTVWFVNIYPGPVIYELEGHSALRIKSPQDDVAINYGLFDFNSPNFIMRFVRGETDYMVGAQQWNGFINEYVKNGRRIVAHKLNLSSAEKRKLIELLKENLRPENREYRYNYVLDNCATRPLRMVERAIGDSIMLPEPSPGVSGNTFRNIMRRYHGNYPWYQFGIDLALGRGIDRAIDVREKAFAPVVLDNQIRNAYVSKGNRPLVTETEIINDTSANGAIIHATPWYLTPLFLSWLLATIGSGWGLYLVFYKKKYPRVFVSIMMTINGVAGSLVFFLIFFSAHEATSPNANILWLNPLCFLPAVSIWIKKAKSLNKWYFLINFVLLFILIVLWTIGYQSPNAAFVPLVLTDMLLSALYLYKFRFLSEKV